MLHLQCMYIGREYKGGLQKKSYLRTYKLDGIKRFDKSIYY